MEHLIDKVIEMHKLGLEIDKEIETCGVMQHEGPKWHIFEYKDFLKVAEALGEIPVRDTSIKDKVYAAKYIFTHRGVEVFCLRTRKEETHDAGTAG